MITDINQLDTTQTYTYAQYLTWRFAERVELIKGRLFKMSPAPARKHQKALVKLVRLIDTYLDATECEVYVAPFDVRFPVGSDAGEANTVVQPDLCVICDKSKLDDKGCVGAPDFIVEVLSPATTKKDIGEKFNLYQEQGVREYWIVSPEAGIVDVFVLDEFGKYNLVKKYSADEKVKVHIFDNLYIHLAKVF